MPKAKPIPDGFHAVTPYLAVHQVRDTIEFLKRAFDAEEVDVHAMPDGTIMNAIVQIRDSRVLLGEKPRGEKPWPAMLYCYVEDVDAVFAKAKAAGGRIVQEPTDQIYGERNAAVDDPSGNQWWISTRLEDLTMDEILARAAQQH